MLRVTRTRLAFSPQRGEHFGMALPATPDLVDAARALRPIILEHRERTEHERRIAPEVVDALIEARLFRLWVPSDVEGLAAPPATGLAVFEELARADASTAWVTWNNSLPAVLSRALDTDTRRELFQDPRAVFANSTRPSGEARRVDGGMRLRGRWSLVSGCEHANWIPLMAPVMEGDAPARSANGVPDLRMFFVPRDELEILDTWYTGGLRGSGSHDVVVEEVWVPEARSCAPLAEARIEGPLYRFPFAPLLASGCAALCLGVARSAIETLVDHAATRAQIDPGPAMRERPTVHSALARAEGGLESSRLYLHDAVASVWTSCQTGSPSLAERARLWRAVLLAAQSSKEIIGRMFELGGTTAVYNDSLLDRCQRDIWTMGQHIILQPHWLEEAGRVSLGLEPKQALF